MSKYYFPAVFDSGLDSDQGFTVTFPDLPGCVTEGSNLNEAMYMAKDVLQGFLYIMEEDNEEMPYPSNPNHIKLPDNGFISIIEVWTDYVREATENKSIKKTLTLPKWLNDAAEDEGINFSHSLQFAIKEQLGIKRKDHL